MNRITLSLLLIFILFNSLFGQLRVESGYLSPIKSPFSFSGGFGELRRNHFHTGLDFRTAGQIGIPVIAVKEGFVARVSVSPTGYGHALYLIHPDGRETVYGHLSRFEPKIEAYVEEQQYKLQQFAVDLTIPEGRITFSKGEIIAWSGNTGSSGGPHLHFEIRDTQSEKPQNPLIYLKGIVDKSSPRINSLYLYPLSTNSSINKSIKKQRIETTYSHQNTGLNTNQPIEIFGDFGLGIQTDDDFNGVGMKCGVFSVQLFVDLEPVFSFKLDHLAFDQGRYINSHIDYEELVRNKRWIHRLFLQPGNKMDIYTTNSSRGILRLEEGKIHAVKVVVSDIFGNSTQLSFKVISRKKPFAETKENPDKLFPYDKANEFVNSEVKLQLPEGALYDKLSFEYHAEKSKRAFYSKIHYIHQPIVPVHKPYVLSIKTSFIPIKFQSKALMVMVDPSGKSSSIGGEYSNEWLTAMPRTFGAFVIALDTIPPIIRSLNINENKTLSNPKNIAFKISDNLSGIAYFEGKIDGNWVLFEYDAKTGTLIYTFDKNRLASRKMHSLVLTVKDERKNSSVYRANFFW